MELQPSLEQMELYMEQWMEWINDVSSRGLLANGGNHLLKTGKVLRSKNVMTDGPYSCGKESVAGYIIIPAKSLYDAVRIAKKCPILKARGPAWKSVKRRLPRAVNSRGISARQ